MKAETPPREGSGAAVSHARSDRRKVMGVVGLALASFGQLIGGLGTALLAMLLLAVLASSWILCVVGIGFLTLPACLRGIRPLADRERRRLTRRGDPIVSPAAPVPAPRDHLADPAARRELAWLVLHGTVDVVLALLGALLPVVVVGALSFPVWWRLLPAGSLSQRAGWASWVVDGPPGVFVVMVLGCVLVATMVPALHAVAWLQDVAGRLLLPPPDRGDMSVRIAELTATRAAALEAHATELRRIERALHDGTQNRLVAVNVLLGGARQALTRDPATALEAIDRAQSATEAALADLRSVARTILPPVLSDRGLHGALDALAAASPISCGVRMDLKASCAAATEATAYFVVSEALTNAARHSGASRVTVTASSDAERLRVMVEDDGTGGARDGAGSGLLGIRRRVEALDGAMTLHSPPGGPTRLEVQLPCGS